jgi:hypothetical protein
VVVDVRINDSRPNNTIRFQLITTILSRIFSLDVLAETKDIISKFFHKVLFVLVLAFILFAHIIVKLGTFEHIKNRRKG